jgi:general stress protein YciG
MVEKKEKKGEMTVEEAGHKGGEKTASTHGSEFYHEIGEKGGHKGGEATAKTHGPEFYKEIGHKGGEAGGKKGGQRVKELVEEGKEAESKK